MKNRTEYICRCQMCDDNIVYVMRDEKAGIGPGMTEAQVDMLIAAKFNEPYQMAHCDGCDSVTVQTFVGYRHV